MKSSATMSALQETMHDFTIMGGNNNSVKIIQGITAQANDINKFASTATITSGFVDFIRYGTSATMGVGIAYLYGFKAS
jgi:hypothetical protein